MLRLVVFRPIQSGPKQGQDKSEWLKGESSRDDIIEEAWALVNDPNDTIGSVKIYHAGWGQYLPLTFAKGWAHDGTHKLKEGEI